MEKVILKSIDEYPLNLHVFEVIDPKGVIQVLHGMEEHQERYEPLVKKLNEAGYSVVTSNMRGHGDDAKELGFFKEKDGDKYLIEDQKIITKYIKERFNVNKVNMYAHSMGTITLRNLMQTESNDYNKVVLSGHPAPNKGASGAKLLTSIHSKIIGPHTFSKFYENLAVNFNKAIKNPRTNLDWLSYNQNNVDEYIKDPYCGHGFKISAINDLVTLVANMSNPSKYKNVFKELPILMISGKDDPCTGGIKGSNASKNVLLKAGFNNIMMKCYPNKRHEILQEENALEVIDDVINFYNK